MQRSKGFALIVVLWYLVLIAAVGTYLMANARSETAIARNIRAAANAEALADAGVAQAIFNLSGTAASNRWSPDGVPHLLRLRSGEVNIRVFDETAKINPNHASDAVLTGLFEAVGIDRGQAQHLGAAIADWAGSGTEPRLFGAKQSQYTAAGRSYGPPNAPIESLDELQLVLGMTPEILASVSPYLTIYTPDEQLNEKDAPPAIKRALALARVASLKSSADGEGDDNAASPMQDGAGENIVDIESAARSSDDGIFVRHAIVRIDPSSGKGYEILDWRRGDLGGAVPLLSD